MNVKLNCRFLFISVIVVLLLLIIRPVGFLLMTYYQDKKHHKTETKGFVNDASHLNQTKVYQVVKVQQHLDAAVLQISELVKTAARQNKKISIAGSQHSMGGHTIYPDAILLDMKALRHLKFDSSTNILTAGSGARWSEVIPYLDKHGRSVAIMQSNNSFTVGGSISVNCHGWTPDAPPISSSVQSFRLINAEGELVHCSRTENPELFSLVLGGYGLFGIIIDVNLKVVDNQTYKVAQSLIRSEDYVTTFNKLLKIYDKAGMVYGRINVTKDHFMEEAIISIYSVDSGESQAPLLPNGYATLRRTVFRGSVNSDYGKSLRWKSEKAITTIISRKKFSRNQLQNEGVEVFENADPRSTDILQEYFIPMHSAARFIRMLQQTVPHYKVDLLNITLRNVKKDNDTYLTYANEDVLGFVMLFNQSKDSTAEYEMKKFTQCIIDSAAKLNGTYYLPYRLHATKLQFKKVYPESDHFFALKKKYDPQELFQNKFYDAYK